MLLSSGCPRASPAEVPPPGLRWPRTRQAHWEGRLVPLSAPACCGQPLRTPSHSPSSRQSIPCYCLVSAGSSGHPQRKQLRSFLRAAIKSTTAGGLGTREIYSLGPRGQKSGIKVLAGPGSLQRPQVSILLGLFQVCGLWPHDPNLCLRSPVCPFLIRASVILGVHLMTSF